MAPQTRSKRAERIALLERAPAEIDWGSLPPDERWTARNIAWPISDGFSQAELGKFYGLSKMQIARRMAALRRAIEEQLEELEHSRNGKSG